MSKAQVPSEPVSVSNSEQHLHEDAFEMLSSARRRHVVHYLQQEDQGVSLRQLSRQLAAWKSDLSPEEITWEERKRVYTALRQSHLPKLDERGFVQFDEDAGTVSPTERLDDLQVFMDVVPENEIPWSVYYLGLGGVAACLSLAKFGGLFPFSELSGLAWAGIITALLLASAVAHVYVDRQNKLGSDGTPPAVREDGE